MFVEQLWVGAGVRLGPSGTWQRALKLLLMKSDHMAGYRVSYDPFSDFAEWKVLCARCWRNCVLSLAYVCLPTFKIELIIQDSSYSTKLLWTSNEVRDWKVLWERLEPWGACSDTSLGKPWWVTPRSPLPRLERVPLLDSLSSLSFSIIAPTTVGN